MLTNCRVEQDKMGNLTVTFDSGKELFLQGDVDKANFAVDCDLIKAPHDWDGLPSNLPDVWWDADFESIEKCLEEYEDMAQLPEK